MATTKNDDGTVTVMLDYPIMTKAGTKLGEITIGRLNAKQLRALDKGEGQVSRTLELLQTITGIEMPFLDTLDGQDYMELAAAVNGFLGRSLGTGDAA